MDPLAVALKMLAALLFLVALWPRVPWQVSFLAAGALAYTLADLAGVF